MAITQQARAAPGFRGPSMGEWHPVALTALVYLQEAVRRERYEECAGYLAIAREFGALENDIQGVLAQPRRSLKAQQAAHVLGLN